jgi:predicted house-cleaning noncanonical NTP pyrophosphatase (MazG superfamily)
VDKLLKFIEETSVNMPTVDFTKFDLNQLRQLSRELSDTIDQKTEEEREKAAAEIKRIASALGMTVEEILASKKGKRGRKPKAKEGVSISLSPEPLGEELASIEAPVEAPVVKSIEQEEEKQKKEKRKPTKR